MNKTNKKILTLALTGLLNATVIGCSSKIEEVGLSIVNEKVSDTFTFEEEIDEPEILKVESVNVSLEKEEVVEETIEEEKIINEYIAVRAINKTEILDTNSSLLGYLAVGQSLRLLTCSNERLYEVDYYGKNAYVKCSDVEKIRKYEVNLDMLKVVYVPSECTLTLFEKDEEITIPENECLEVYDEISDMYLVKYEDNIGYVNKQTLEDLTGVFVVVDISDQELKLYEDNKVLLDCPVVTGKPGSPTDEGLFEIYHISKNRYLVGPTWKSYVNFMLKFNGGEGLHDAERWVDENGFKHGWKDKSEFGGDTYLKKGSHGCVNMLHDDVEFVYNKAEMGTRVLVKK